MMNYRQTLHHKSPALQKIARFWKRDGYYYFDGQKRKPESRRKDGENIIIEGKIISPI